MSLFGCALLYTGAETNITYVDYTSDSVQIGDGYTACISIEFDGILTVPSEINAKKVVCVASKAFSDCKVHSINLPDSIQIIKSYAFQNTIFPEFICPPSVQTVEERAFFNTQLKFANFFNSSAEFIGTHHFYASQIENILLPQNMTTFSVHMFISSKLKNITIPKTCTEIGSGAFICSNNLTEFFSESPLFVVFNKALYSNDFKTLIGYPSDCELNILPTTTRISGIRGFSGSSFSSYVLRLPIAEVEGHTFRSCVNLEYLDLSCGKFTSLSNANFAESKKLKTLILPQSLELLGISVFLLTSIKELVLPSKITTVWAEAFNTCNITDIYYCGSNVISGTINAASKISAHVSLSYSSSKFIGCNIVENSYVCQYHTCISLYSDQTFMKCKTVPFRCPFTMSKLLYLVFILMQS